MLRLGRLRREMQILLAHLWACHLIWALRLLGNLLSLHLWVRGRCS